MQMSKQNKQKYASIYSLINLPKRRHLDLGKQTVFQKTEATSEEQSFIGADLKRNRNILVQNFQKDIQIFQTNYDFKFPESKFPDVPENEQNTISYQSRDQQERNQPIQERLSDLQLQQMREKGQFQVRVGSQKDSVPYVWKINDCILKGRVNRLNIWEDGVAWCYSRLRDASNNLVQTVPKSLLKIIKTPLRYFDLFFGRKCVRQIYCTNTQQEIFKEFWTEIMQNQLKDLKNEVGHQFLEEIYVKYETYIYLQISENASQQEKVSFYNTKQLKLANYNKQIGKKNEIKESLKSLQNAFEGEWIKVRKNIFNKISAEAQQYKQKSLLIEADQMPLSSQTIKKKDESVVEKLYEQKFLLYTAYLKQNLPKLNINKAIIQPLLALVILFSIIHFKKRLKNDKIAEIQSQTTLEVKKNHPIRSRNYEFLQSTVSQQMKPIREQIQIQFQEKTLKDLQNSKFFPTKYQKIYMKYQKFCKSYHSIEEKKKKQEIHMYVPDKVFHSSYSIMFPYQVIKNSSGFYIKKQQTLESNTGYYFWKCGLYAIRMKSWSLNCLKFFLGLSWYGRFGLRTLCGLEDFVYDQNVSYKGQKIPIYRSTVLGVFKTVIEGISKSRDDFEALPDEGLFGRKCSRLCNLIECYIFRFFIVGIIGVLVLLPIATLLFSVLFFILAITFWMYVPLALLITYLFNILIFEVDYSRKQECYIRLFPLIGTIVILIIQLVKVIGSILYLVLIAPLISFFYLIFLLMQRGIRTITDSIMVCLIGCLGRTPRRDTNIATKISGPGMSSNYFSSISQQDVYVLSQSAIQKIFVNKFIALTKEQIRLCDQKFNIMCSFVLAPFGLSRPDLKDQKQYTQINLNNLLTNFNKKSQRYMARYPNTPYNVRFTQEELQLYFENSVKIIKNFIEKNKMQDWIFEQKNILNGDYEQLTRHLWYEIFNCHAQIFEPLQAIDSRFRLVDEANNNSEIMKKNVRYVLKSLQGQVSLTKTVAKIQQHGKSSLLTKDIKINQIQQICFAHTNNSEMRIRLDLQDSTTILIAPRDLKQLQKYDKYLYEKSKLKALP